jgi:tight adherence protein B
MDYLYYIFGTLVFIIALLLIEAVHLRWSHAKGPHAKGLARLKRIIEVDDKDATRQGNSIIKERLLSTDPRLQNMLLQLPGIDRLDRLLVQSGLASSTARLLGLTLLTALAGFAAGSYFGLPWMLRLLPTATGAALPFFYVIKMKANRMAKIECQLPDALDLMGRALRAGHAFPTALQMAGDELSDPLAAEFRTAFDEVSFGIALPDAILNLAKRVPSTDLRYFVVAVLIQRETGGNLSELLSNISAIIRDRIKLQGQIRVLSTEGRLSGWVLTLLPFGAALMMQFTNPEFLKVLYTDPDGINLLVSAGGMMLLGIFVMRNIVRIRV